VRPGCPRARDGAGWKRVGWRLSALMRFCNPVALGLSLFASSSLRAPGLGAEEAGSVTARLDWRQLPGAETCLDGETLKRAVNARWGRSVFVEATNADISLSGTIGRSRPNQWTASLVLRRADGTSLGSRELITAAPDCSSLDDSVALAVGLMLDVSRRRIVEERHLVEAEAQKPHETVLDGPPISIPKETLPPREPFRVEPSIGGEAAVGFLPRWGLAARAGVGILPAHFVRVEVSAALWKHDEERTSGGRGAQFSAWTAELALCPLSWRYERTRVDACVTERFGQIKAIGFGFQESATATEPLFNVGARGTTTVELAPPLGVFLGVGLEAPLVRYRFVFGDPGGGERAIYRMAPAMGSLALGLSLEW
jgi:hypothetical protein